MRFDKILPRFIAGKRIKRRAWSEPKFCRYIYINKDTDVIWASFDDKDVEMGHITWKNILADDWEIMEDEE
jgi:hypothetical protein